MRKWLRLFLTGIALCFLWFLVAQAATTGGSGVYVEVKSSDSSGASVESYKLYGSSHALVIGINNYSNGWPRLSNAIKDAKEVAKAMEARGFEVELVLDPVGSELRDKLRRFFSIKGADPEARLFVWYAGHGYTWKGEGYLVPSDAPAVEDPEFRFTALHMGDVGSMVRIAEAKHTLAVFDSCFAGTVFSNARSKPPIAITKAAVRPVRQFLTSGDADQQVSDDGSFRKLFLAALEGEEAADLNADGYLTGTELGFYLEDRVLNLTDGAQTPRSGKLKDQRFDRGDFIFVLPDADIDITVTNPTANEPSDKALDLAFWQSIQGSDNPANFEAYLSAHPDGNFVQLARNRIQELKESKTEQVAALPPEPDFEIEELDETLFAVKRSNLRSGPGTNYDKVGLLEAGEEVSVTGRVKGKSWYRVALREGQVAFVFDKLLGEKPRPKPEPAPAPVVTPAPEPKQEPEPQVEPVVGVYPEPRKPGDTFKDCDVCPEMVVVPKGSFMMGSPEYEANRADNEGPQHLVTIDYELAVGKYEVTFAEWDTCVSAGECGGHRPDDSGWGRGSRPVINVSWDDAKAFVGWLNRRTGKSYRLLSEAEWEYVARGGHDEFPILGR